MRAAFEHLPISCLVGLVGWLISYDSMCLVGALLGGWLIDADHLVDLCYYVCRNSNRSFIQLFKSGSYFKANGKVFVPLHSWEIVLVAGYLSYKEGSCALAVSALAMALHLLQDQLTYHVRTGGYFIFSRAVQRFNIINFCTDKQKKDV